MTEIREVFPILADATSGAGEPAISRIEGEAAAGQEGLIGFSFKDSSGNVVLPQLDSSGRIPVTTDDSGICLSARGEDATGSLTFVDIATITAALTKVYRKIGFNVSSTRSTHFQLVHVDDSGGTPAETVLADAIVGPGQYSHCCELECTTYDTTGGTGVQEFKLKGKNLVLANCMRGNLAVFEEA